MKTAIIRSKPVRSNGLRRLAGGWSETEYRQFEQAVEPFGGIDTEMWQCRCNEGGEAQPDSGRRW